LALISVKWFIRLIGRGEAVDLEEIVTAEVKM